MKDFEKVGIIGVPQDLGASRRGVDLGPTALRIANLKETIVKLGYEVMDFGNISCHDPGEHSIKDTNPKLRYLDHIIDTCKKLKIKIKECLDKNAFPLVIGGDHSVSIGSLAGMKKYHDGKTGIIWIDAHGDFNTENTSPSGNIHGMPFAAILNRGNQNLTSIGPSPSALEKNAVLFAARDLDSGEIDNLENSEVTLITMRNIDEMGIAKAAKKAIDIATEGVDYLHISFDIDALDPREAPGTGTVVQGGLTYREAHLLMELIHDCGKLTSFELLEVNPTLDVRNQTAKLAVGLIASALGKKIVNLSRPSPT